MNSDPKPATIKNHSDSGMSVARPPPTARIRKPLATIAMSMTG